MWLKYIHKKLHSVKFSVYLLWFLNHYKSCCKNLNLMHIFDVSNLQKSVFYLSLLDLLTECIPISNTESILYTTQQSHLHNKISCQPSYVHCPS